MSPHQISNMSSHQQPTAPPTTTTTTATALAMPAASASPVALPHPHPHPHPHPNKRFHTPPAASATTGRFPSSLMAVMNLDDGGDDSALLSDDEDDADFADDVPVGPAQEACRAAVAPAARAGAVAPISHGAAPTSSASASAVFAAAVAGSPPPPSANGPVSASHALAPPMPMHTMQQTTPLATGMTPAVNGAMPTPTHHARHLHQHHPTAPLGHHHQQLQHQHQQHAPLAHPFHVAMPSAPACTSPPPAHAQAPTQASPLPWLPAGLHAQPVAHHHALPQQQHLQYAPAHQQQYLPQPAHVQHYPARHAHHAYPTVSAPALAPVATSSYPHQDASMSSYYRENPYRTTPPAPLHHAAAASAAAQPWSAAPATSSSPRTSPPLPPPQARSWAPLADRSDRDRPFPPPAAAAPAPTPHWDASRAASIDNQSSSASASADAPSSAASQAAATAQPATPWEALLSVAAAESSSLDRQSESAASSSAESSPTSSARVRAVPTVGDVPALARVAPQVPTPAPTPTPPMHPAPRGHRLAPPHVTAAGAAPRRASWAPTSSTTSSAAGTSPAVAATAAAAAAGTPESDILDRITWMPTGMPLVARAAGAPAILAALLTDGKAFRCIPCGQRFRRKADTVRHVRSLHTAEKPHICPACHRGFARVDALKRHLDTDPECAAKGIVRENARCNAVPVLSSRRRASVPAGVALARGDEAMVAALIGAARAARGSAEAAGAQVSAE
ncbi:hypothetical protein AMAG_09402 [Allomyces macrogynus ATCC 38327]|uniref:C2H2-type domain-containing protein n=1 Tax=Allomyces macrogynus (strain ATCC 38327) TaxID=578462 RepID=A0A0L0SPD1_ALLM3|nr:hypothetical protein AMAG_09402 [Allomyces macrogynus ATCC 38327]|eukprot:KNE64376.1 hypothetical protein AMAG_09402 [Allomyces macrogynus ATCC 38327]